jgi:hypothetical protein
MPKASRTTASETVEVEGYEGHLEDLDGGYTVAFETYTADADLTPAFAGLPDDRCQCEHWGYVVPARSRSRPVTARRPSRRGTRTTSRPATPRC